MIIKTKTRQFTPHIKLILILIVVSILCYGLGFSHGYAKGWASCVDFGLNFIDFDNVLDKELIRTAILQYKESLGGWAFDPNSPFYVGK